MIGRKDIRSKPPRLLLTMSLSDPRHMFRLRRVRQGLVAIIGLEADEESLAALFRMTRGEFQTFLRTV
jgi:hypothetical protein